MTNAGLEQSRRMSAIRHAAEAMRLAVAVHEKWIRVAATRAMASELRLATNDLSRALAILRDEHGMHWDAAGPLETAANVYSG